MKFTYVFLILVSMLSISCATTISGILLNEKEAPVSSNEGKINIIPLSQNSINTPPQIIDLDEDGSFETNLQISPGEYLVEPLIPGYVNQSIRTTVSESVYLKIILKSDPPPPGKNITPNMEVKLDRGPGDASLTPPQY